MLYNILIEIECKSSGKKDIERYNRSRDRAAETKYERNNRKKRKKIVI